MRGFSFHVGSQAPDPLKHVEAIEACIALLRQARREKLGRFDMLDIGGGFPIDYAKRVPDIGRFCAPIRKALAAVPRGVRMIAEPGRYIAGARCHRRGQRDGPGRARRPVVVLPRRRPVRIATAASCTITRTIRSRA